MIDSVLRFIGTPFVDNVGSIGIIEVECLHFRVKVFFASFDKSIFYRKT
ncbi:hypothetical protein SDC9_169980 [bioreactor metagenome]|uniref:Uncharacterized protein n=1 Tax=bioreactor metagenome TaxID=1076179 RepID=A0A645G6S9_9ZZZZ